MFSQVSKPAGVAVATVRLPQPATAIQGRNLLGALPQATRPALPAPAPKRGQHRADQARYQAKCRVASCF